MTEEECKDGNHIRVEPDANYCVECGEKIDKNFRLDKDEDDFELDEDGN